MELILNGYITNDYDWHPALTYSPLYEWELCGGQSIPDSIQQYFNYQRLDRGLGEKITTIPNCNLSIYFTKEECTLEEAQKALLNKLYGDMYVHTKLLGYSEYTITGLDLETFCIGGHDLTEEFNSHRGEYCWIIITD